MSVKPWQFQKGHQINLDKRNAAKDYRMTFTREAFNRKQGDIEIIFDRVIDTAKNGKEGWLDTAKLIFRHFLTMPPAEILFDDAEDKKPLNSEETEELLNTVIATWLSESQAAKALLVAKEAQDKILARREIIAVTKHEEPLQPVQNPDYSVSSENQERFHH